MTSSLTFSRRVCGTHPRRQLLGGGSVGRAAPPFRIYLTIARSPAVWAITLAHTLNDCALYMLDDGLPPYLRDVHGLDLSSIGVLLGINGALKPVVIVVSAIVADRLRRCVRTLHVRKAVTALSFLPQAVFLFALSARVVDTPAQIVPLLLVVAPLNLACNGGGYAVNYLDIAPSLSSLVLAFYNMGGQVMGWMTPWLIGELTPYPNGESRSQMELNDDGVLPSDDWVAQLSREWRTVFLIGGCANVAATVAFLTLASDQVQPWARVARAPDDSSSLAHARSTSSRRRS